MIPQRWKGRFILKDEYDSPHDKVEKHLLDRRTGWTNKWRHEQPAAYMPVSPSNSAKLEDRLKEKC